MDTAPAALSRRRALTLSPEAFRWLALGAVAMLILIVASGATVRLTGSGLGCPHWPTCTATHAAPRGYHSDIEFSNRVISVFTVLSTLLLGVGAWRTRGLGRRAKWLATASSSARSRRRRSARSPSTTTSTRTS